MLNEFERRPLETGLVLICSALGVELTYILLGVLSAAWGAIDEPLRTSLRYGLQRAWLHTPHVLLAVVLCGTLIASLEQAGRQASAQIETLMAREMAQKREAGQQPTQQEWQASYARYHELWLQRPFYLRYNDEIAATSAMAAGAWWLWGLLRFSGARRPRVPIARAPTCEACGYNLTGIPLEGRCPECGEPAILSLGPDVRSGTPWHHRRAIGRRSAWWQCAAAAVARPSWFGRQIRLSEPTTDHRSFFGYCLGVVFLVAWVGMVCCLTAESGRNPFTHDREIVWAVGPVTGYFSAVAVLMFALGAAALVGVAHRVPTGRNLLAASMQAGCYLGGYLVALVAFTFFWPMFLFCCKDIVNQIGRQFHVYRELVWYAFMFLPTLFGLFFYVYLVSRVTSGARYANR